MYKMPTETFAQSVFCSSRTEMPMNLFHTDLKHQTITEITPEELRSLGVKALAIDADNTSGYDARPEPLPGVIEWIADMKQAGFPVLLLSNAELKRAKVLADKLGIPAVGLACKPLPIGYFRAAKALHVKRNELAMVGDQLFTDIAGANLVGVKAVYVFPYAPEERSVKSFRRRRKWEQKIFARQEGNKA